MTRLVLTRQTPQHIDNYAEQTRRLVADLAAQLQVLFEDERAGRMDRSWAVSLDRLFALWCEQSGVVTPTTTRSVLERIDPWSLPEVLKAVRVELGFNDDDATQACDAYVARARAGANVRTLRRRLEQRLYASQIRSLCIQSAHVTLARAVLYRVLEDLGISQRRLSGAPLVAALDANARGMVGAPSVFRLLEDMRAASEGFLPSLYQRRELDWWLIDFPRRDRGQGLFDQRMGPVEVELARMLRLLDTYDFSNVDQDVWRDVYEHHLPWEERQRLGSFYTPDAIVCNVLDMAGWTAATRAITDRTIADISCGSGAFLVEALRRRREALTRARRLPADPTPEQMDHLVTGVVGLDVHPFATFLASVNVLFQVIDLYQSVRRRHPDYALPLNIFTVDSLEDSGAHPRQAELQRDLPEDIRIRHTEEEIARYQTLRAERFDVIVGNPPWGGLLKGRLSPLNDPDKRRRYARSGQFVSATGKYDIFVLFVERSVQWLADDGTYGFVLPSSYRDRGFGRGLRGLLVGEGPPDAVVDLLPFGQLLFRAMNTPTLLSGRRTTTAQDLRVVSIARDFPFNAEPAHRQQRQQELGAAVASALVGQPTRSVTTYVESAETVRSWGAGVWLIDPNRSLRELVERSGEFSVADVIGLRQGVTPGGEGVSDVFQMMPEDVDRLHIEEELTHRMTRGVELRVGPATPADTLQLYPYLASDGGSALPAFAVAVPGGGSWDALDPQPHSDAERRLVAGLTDHQRHRRLVEHRIAEGRCPFPAAAQYLVDHYDLLASRRLEGKPITHFQKYWWEYHRPRDPATVLSSPKIIGPRRGMQWPRFALDDAGMLPPDSCVALTTPPAGRGHHGRVREQLAVSLGRAPTNREVLIYVMAFLNSSASAACLRIGRLPTAKGSWTVDDRYFAAVRIAVPTNTTLVLNLLSTAARVAEAADGQPAHEERRQLDELVAQALGLDADARERLDKWADEQRPPDW